MNQNTKKNIKKFAKITGKYTLKGLGKGVELAGRGSLRIVNTLVKDPQVQKIATGAGILAASIMIPSVGVGIMSILGLKKATDKYLFGKNKGMMDEFVDLVRVGNTLTRNVCNKIVSPAIAKGEQELSTLGKKYQKGVEGLLR